MIENSTIGPEASILRRRKQKPILARIENAVVRNDTVTLRARQLLVHGLFPPESQFETKLRIKSIRPCAWSMPLASFGLPCTHNPSPQFTLRREVTYSVIPVVQSFVLPAWGLVHHN